MIMIDFRCSSEHKSSTCETEPNMWVCFLGRLMSQKHWPSGPNVSRHPGASFAGGRALVW